MIYVHKPYLPDKKKYFEYINSIYENHYLTNNGPLLQKLEERLKEYLGVDHMVLVANGTIALQVAYKVLGLKNSVITTPFSFAATTSSLAWEGLTPRFADIDSATLNIDPHEIEKSITPETTGIAATHVFGNACDVDAIEKIAQDNQLKVVYDAAHAFGVNYQGSSLLNKGDISTLSFHATKVYHTVEGGALVMNDSGLEQETRQMINFGIDKPDSIGGIGINGKMSEVHAAMGLCVLDEIDQIMEARREVYELYENSLKDHFQLQKREPNASPNYSYFPVIFRSEKETLAVESALKEDKIIPRRYFYPSLDTLPYTGGPAMNNSREIARRILCLPLYPGLKKSEQEKIINITLTTSRKSKS